MKLIAQGAEAKIYEKDDVILKERVKKSYRLPQIDLALRKRRTRSEAKLLQSAARIGVNVPRVLDTDDKKMLLKIENIRGEKVRDWLETAKLGDAKTLMKQVGQDVGKLHQSKMVHGDLTTSNMILKDKLFLIDFGLGQVTDRLEDKAVDIHLFKECLRSKHHKHWKALWLAFKDGYKDEKVLGQMRKVESRARYKKVS